LRVAAATSSPKAFSGLLDFELERKGELLDFEELSELAWEVELLKKQPPSPPNKRLETARTTSSLRTTNPRWDELQRRRV
jgi:hypothetical protein